MMKPARATGSHTLYFLLLAFVLISCILCFTLISQFSCRICTKIFQNQRRSHFVAEVIFKNHKILQRIHAFLDSLKELLLIRNIMTFVITQKHFADTQQHFVVTQKLFAHLDVCCYIATMLIHCYFCIFPNFMLWHYLISSSKLISHPVLNPSSIALTFMTSHMPIPFWVAYIPLSFFSSFFPFQIFF